MVWMLSNEMKLSTPYDLDHKHDRYSNIEELVHSIQIEQPKRRNQPQEQVRNIVEVVEVEFGECFPCLVYNYIIKQKLLDNSIKILI